MDLLKIEQNKNMSTFMELLLERELYPLITRPTRITRSSATLIDNIIVSCTLYHSNKSVVLINDLSDHLPCISVLGNIKSRKGEKVNLIWRNMCHLLIL